MPPTSMSYLLLHILFTIYWHMALGKQHGSDETKSDTTKIICPTCRKNYEMQQFHWWSIVLHAKVNNNKFRDETMD